MTTATRKKTARPAPKAEAPPAPKRRGNPEVAIKFPGGRAVLSPVQRPRDGTFYRLAFSLYVDDAFVCEFVERDCRAANARHDALAAALRKLADPPKEKP